MTHRRSGTAPRSAVVSVALSALIVAGTVLACREPGFGSVVDNKSDMPLIVEYVPMSSDVPIYGLRVGPNERGGGLGGSTPFDPWEGATVNVLTTECVEIGFAVLTSDAVNVVIAVDGTVTMVGDDEVEATTVNLPEDTSCSPDTAE